MPGFHFGLTGSKSLKVEAKHFALFSGYFFHTPRSGTLSSVASWGSLSVLSHLLMPLPWPLRLRIKVGLGRGPSCCLSVVMPQPAKLAPIYRW